MPKTIFYAGTAFCLFLALVCAAEGVRQLETGEIAFAALRGPSLSIAPRAGLAIAIALAATLATAVMIVRMAALVAARDLFGAFVALFSVTAAVASIAWTLLLQSRIIALVRAGAANAAAPLAEMHLAACLTLGLFLSLALFSLRPYFRIQASRFLSAVVAFPLPLFLLILAQEMFVSASRAPLPASTPAMLALLATLAVIFCAVSIHCVRHRHLFLEMTNLREILGSRVDLDARPNPMRLGNAAFDA